MRRGLLLLLAAAAAAGSGCGGSSTPRPTGPAALQAAPVVLRAQLAAALGERPWLVAAAARAARTDGARSPAAVAAHRTLDAGTVAAADGLARALGAARRDLVLRALRRQDELWLALAAGDVTARAATRRRLRAADRELATVLAVRGLGPRALERRLASGTTGLARALALAAAASPVAPRRLAQAATGAARPAGLIALAAGRRRGSTGSARSPAADLATLAATSFTTATYTRAAVVAAVLGGARARAGLAADRAADDEAARALGLLVGAVHGVDAGRRFRTAWGAASTALVGGARAARAGDGRAAARARTGLERADTAMTTLLAEVDPDGDPRELTRALARAATADRAAAQAAAARAPALGARLRAAADAARAVGQALAARAVRQHPSRFPA